MSTDDDDTAPLPAQTWEPLSLLERRILGVLIEKQKTSRSAETYPLSLNSLTTGCNQKSNRDPILDLSEEDVEECLEVLQKKNLVMRLTGGRVARFKHELYDKWTRHGAQMAVLAELLLRGPQTKGELRVRASRMDAIDSLDTLEDVLKPLVERRLAIHVTEPDRRGSLVSHGFHSVEEVARLKALHAGAALDQVVSPRVESSSGGTERRLQDAEGEIAKLKAAVAALEEQVAELRRG